MSVYIIHFERVHKGYYDPRTGEAIASVAGMLNREGIDPFESAGYAEPDLSGFNIVEEYRNGIEVIVVIDSNPATYISNNVLEKYTKSWIVTKIDKQKIFTPHLTDGCRPSDFSFQLLTREQLDIKKAEWDYDI